MYRIANPPSGAQPRHDFRVHLEIGVDILHVVRVLQRLEQLEEARGAFLVSACQKTDGVYFVEIDARRCLPPVSRAGRLTPTGKQRYAIGLVDGPPMGFATCETTVTEEGCDRMDVDKISVLL